jgi:hypothetical protein
MSTPNDRLAALEAAAWANTSRIEHLSKTNKDLAYHNAQQRGLIAQYKQDFDVDIEADIPLTHTATSSTESTITPRPMFSHPGPRLTPFYLAARSSPLLSLSFVVQGMQGETLESDADTMDVAFMLEQTLKRRGWRDEKVKRSVLAPLMKAECMKSADVGRVGRLAR